MITEVIIREPEVLQKAGHGVLLMISDKERDHGIPSEKNIRLLKLSSSNL
jgi:hypothetical protein